MSGESMFAVITIATMVFSVWMIRNQQRTIDSLTNKLMARSYVEYKSMDKIKEDDVSPAREVEPKSWHDN